MANESVKHSCMKIYLGPHYASPESLAVMTYVTSVIYCMMEFIVRRRPVYSVVFLSMLIRHHRNISDLQSFSPIIVWEALLRSMSCRAHAQCLQVELPCVSNETSAIVMPLGAPLFCGS